MSALDLLERALEVLSDESGMVVCWHEYDEVDLRRSECVQCLVQAAANELFAAGSE